MKKTILTTLVLLAGIFAFGQTTNITYTTTGNVDATFYSSGEHTERVTYYEDGSIKEVANFNKNVPNGEWVTYNTQGDIVKKGSYKDGVKTGTWMIWSETKTQMYKCTYLNNKRVNAVEWAAEN